MKNTSTLSITIIMGILTIGVLSSASISSPVADISLFNRVFAQESAEVFIAPGASDPNNAEAFVPPQISVSSEGNIVSWTNEDSTEHTVTADDGSFDSGPISPGDTFENTLDSPGDFGYHCEIHPFMTGVVIVE
ncbi:MAG: Copper binding protein plastocyanin/azurin family [Nitrososphaeraceae archaeon]|jgi:plastocyanin|nr:Copper binding protein plastocyanin/azurin family [Nitrososphaeraceae archaeon]